jgi:hypothetical protein
MQGNYSGIGIGKVNNQWRFRNKIAGFDSSAYFEITDALEVYISHEYKGVLGLQLDNELKAKSVTVYEQPKKEKCQHLTIQFIMPIKTGILN